MNNKNNKNLIFIFVSLVVLAGITFYLLGQNNGGEASLSSGIERTNVSESKKLTLDEKLLETLRPLDNLSIDTNFFSSSMLKSLKSLRVDIPNFEKQRENPFAPIPGRQLRNN